MEDEELEVSGEKEVKQDKGIRIGEKYILKSDSLNLILEEYGFKGASPKDSKKARDEGIILEPKWGLIGQTYHRTLQQVLDYFLDYSIINADVDALKELVQVVEQTRSEFKQFKNCTRLVEDSLEVIK